MIKNQNHLGGICMILSVLFFSLMDVLIKITNEYDVGQVMFSRALFGLIPIFFLIPRNKLKNFYKTNYPNDQKSKPSRWRMYDFKRSIFFTYGRFN